MWRWSIGMDGIALLGFVPPPALGGLVFAELGPTGEWYVWPGFRLGVAYASSVSWRGDTEVGARWQWLFAHAEACPLRFRPGALDLYVGVCAVVDAGGITSQGRSLVNRAPTATRGWVAPGLLARLSWGLPQGLLFELGGELSWPVRPLSYTYVDKVQGELELARISGPGETVSLGVGYRFP
jgi:hypothetical protein